MTVQHDIEIRAKNYTDKVFKDIRQSFEGIERKAKEVGAKIAAAWKALPLPMKLLAAAVVAATAAMVKLITVALQASARIDKLAKNIRAAGIETEAGNRAYQTMLTFLERAGISSEQYQQSLRTINLRVSEAIGGNEQYIGILERAGIAYTDMNGNARESIDVLGQLIVKFTEGQLSLAEFSKLAGEEAGPNIAQAFSNIEGGLDGFLEAMDRAGKETAYVSLVTQGVNEDWQDLGDSFSRRGQMIGNAINGLIIPPLLWMGEKLLWIVDQLMLVGSVTKEVFGAMKDIFSGMLLVLDGVGEGIASAFLWAWGKTLEGFGDMLNSMSDTLNDWFSNAPDWFKKISGIDSGWGSGIQEAGQALLSRAAESAAGSSASFTTGFNNMVEGGNRILNLPQFIKDSKTVNDGFDAILKQQQEMEENNRKIAESLSGGGSGGGSSSVVEAVEETTEAATELGDRFKSIWEGVFTDGKVNFDKLKENFLNVLADMVTEALFSGKQISQAFGSGGGMNGWGDFFGTIVNAFAGMFDTGGYIPKGQFGIVGEKGPELVSGPANVTSRRDTAAMIGGGGSDAVVYAPVFNTTVNPSKDTSPEEAKAFADQFNRAVEAKVTDTIIKLQNRRGAFASGRSY